MPGVWEEGGEGKVNVKAKKDTARWLVGAEVVCVVLALTLVVLWAVGPWCRPMVAWASEDAQKGLQVIAGRVNVHYAEEKLFRARVSWKDEPDSAWFGGCFVYGSWQFEPLMCIPIVGEFFTLSGSTQERDEHGLAWLPRMGSWRAGHTVVSIPLVWLAVVPALAGAWLERRRRRFVNAARTERCGACGYSLSGLATTAACPECGRLRDAR
ncbi:MAG: hypothetical protein QM783_15370 [Phycisphaerales bacterium]